MRAYQEGGYYIPTFGVGSASTLDAAAKSLRRKKRPIGFGAPEEKPKRPTKGKRP